MGKKAAKTEVATQQPSGNEINNSLSQISTAIAGNQFMSSQLSQTTTLTKNNRWYLISNNRQTLSELYVEHGLVQTLVDQPVDDAFGTGFDIKSNQLDGNDVEEILNYCEEHGVIEALMNALKWARLYGGGGVVMLCAQDLSKPFKLDSLKQGQEIDFRDADLWELYSTKQNIQPETNYGVLEQGYYSYTYYGQNIDPSRVLRTSGKKAPSFVRPRLRGWGMSELEKVVRSMNQYMKNQDVLFELLDEAKVDVFRIKGMNTSLLSSKDSAAVATRLQYANTIKNFLNALVMDLGDEYEQKQISFSGMGDIMKEIRMQIACDLKMPITKLFGVSAAGFSSGEDDIENYNSMINSQIRRKAKGHLMFLMKVVCHLVHGFVPDDLTIHWNPLRVLSAEDEEKVKDARFNRTMSGWQSGLVETKAAKQAINRAALLPVEIDENDDVTPQMSGQYEIEKAEQPNGKGGDKLKP